MVHPVVNHRYRLVRLLGEGGTGRVYLAEDLIEDRRPVGFKTLSPRLSPVELIEYFKTEFRSLARLRHPNLAEVYDFGTVTVVAPHRPDEWPLYPGSLFFTMEYIPGSDCFGGTAGMAYDALFEVLVQVCRGLEYIHSRGVIHYDIKPSNILISGPGISASIPIHPASLADETVLLPSEALVDFRPRALTTPRPQPPPGEPAPAAAATPTPAPAPTATRPTKLKTERPAPLKTDRPLPPLLTPPALPLPPRPFQVKILDFGLAGAGMQANEARPKGTVHYMAPELFKGVPIDRRADLYSLGILLYQLVTRKLPFQGNTTLAIARKHLEDAPEPPRLHRADLPPGLESVILRLIAKEPADRFASANQVIRALSETAGRPFELETRSTRESYILTGRFVGREPEMDYVQECFDRLVGDLHPGPLDGEEPAQEPLPSTTVASPPREATPRPSRYATPPIAAQREPRKVPPVNNVVLLAGETGIGKRRVLEEFKHYAQLSGSQVYESGCREEGGLPFEPFLPLFRHALEVVRSDEELLDRYARELAIVVPDRVHRRSDRASLEGDRERIRLVSKLGEFLLEVGARVPLCLGIRDLQGIDQVSGELLRYLAHRLHVLRREYHAALAEDSLAAASPPGGAAAAGASVGVGASVGAASQEAEEPLSVEAPSGAADDLDDSEELLPRLAEESDPLPPVLIVAAYDTEAIRGRPAESLVAELTASGSARELRLLPLTPADIETLVGSMIGLSKIPAALRDVAVRVSGGNPLFLGELMKSLVEEEVLPFEGGGWTVKEDRLAAMSLPSGVEAVVRRRLGRLEPAAKTLLEHLAAYQRELPVEFLSRLGAEVVDAQPALSQLERQGILLRERTPTGPRLRFVHPTTREFLYAEIPEDRRKELHDRIAHLLYQVYPPDRRGEKAEEIAFHLLRGRGPRRAIEPLLSAADRARKSWANDKAIELYEKALSLVDPARIDRRNSILEGLAAASARVGRYDAAIAAYRDVLSKTTEREAEAWLHLRIAECHGKKGELEPANEWIDRGLERVGSEKTLVSVKLLHQRAWLAVQRGICDQGLELARKALVVAEALADEETQAALHNVLGVGHLYQGKFEESREALERSIALHLKNDNLQGLGDGRNNLAALYGYMGDHERSLEEQKKVFSLRERIGDRWGMVLSLGNLGVATHALERNDDAMQYFKRSLALRDEIGMTHGRASTWLNMGNIHFDQGRLGEALRSLDRALALFRAQGDAQGEAIALENLAHLYAYLGAPARGRECLVPALATARRLKLPREEALLARIEGELAVLDRAWPAAAAAFARAREQYERLGSAVEVYRTDLLAAQALVEQGDLASAQAALRAVEERAKGAVPEPLRALFYLLRSRVTPGQSLALLEVARKRLEGRDLPEPAWRVHHALATCLRDRGKPVPATDHFVRALEILRGVHDSLPEAYRSGFLAVRERRALLTDAREFAASTGLLPEGQYRDFYEKGTLMPMKEELPEVDGTRKRLQVAITLLKEENKNLLKLMEINKRLLAELDLSPLLEFIMGTAIELTHAERGFLILVDAKGRMNFEVARNIDKEAIEKPEMQVSHSIAQEVAKSGEAVITSDAQQDQRFSLSESVRDLRLSSVLCVPLRGRTNTQGALYIENRTTQGFFTEKDKELLEAFSDQASIAVENARLYQDNVQKQKDLAKSKAEVEGLNKQLEEANRKLQEKVQVQGAELEEVKEILEVKTRELTVKYNYQNIVARSPKMRDVFMLLDRVTDSALPVVIHGESGTGKELVAKAIHFNGPRKGKHFAAENCAALTETLLESELFGYVKGAFTGADRDRKGLFEIAHGGTLFLDEIGDMSVDMQKKLLRTLESGELRRVGGKDVIKVDVRIIGASNKDLKALTEQQLFREDLYYRLNVFQVKLPPLRDRKEDIPLLVNYLLGEFATESKTPKKSVDAAAMGLLIDYNWPGNIRELKNIIRGVASLSDATQLGVKDFVDKIPVIDRRNAKEEASSTTVGPQGQYLSIDEYTRQFIVQHQDKMSDTDIAKVLGISRKTLWEKRKKWEIPK
ncbi:MAG: sigma 54-interacting transcriptional regulator [Planctomycetes bacterium]|nr:sigma 54-interacting transcriptional regulator [Planctomycetota bacterium]